uniref:non-specific serine/threonine protein kinase n=1 Tax=Salix viminalis TaxID=40686 RepID=A0A6N2LHZ3_SALVM
MEDPFLCNRIFPFEAISGGLNFLCGLRSGGLAILCWETADITQFSSLQPKRIYYSNTVRLTDLTVGDVQVCAREVSSGMVKCWRGVARRRSSFPSPGVDLRFSTIASGSGFTCGILMSSSRVHCWGNNDVGAEIERQFSNLTMLNLVAGESHACGLTRGGILVCKGSNSSRQLDVPFNSAFEFSGPAAGANFTCAVKQGNGLVTCWGKTDIFQLDSYVSENYSFELIVAGMNFLCGLTTSNLSMICWGTGWYNDLHHRNDLPLGMIIPGSCIQSSCSTCGMYPNSEILCGGSGSICKSCRIERPLALPLPPITPPPPEEAQQALLMQSRNKLSLAFMIVGSVGAFAGISTIVYCLGGFLHKRYCNTVQPSITDVNVNTGASVSNHYIAQPVRSFSIKSLGSTRLGFQRNGSSSRLTEKTQNFSLSELLAASNNFSLENKIGAGSFGTVYRGKLHGGREVAIKRGETGTKTRKFQEKESAFDSELALLPRLHHKHLLGLIGFCEENDERLLVYEYMSNGALYDHLHSKENTEKSSSILNSWKMRIKIALDAARGIEYLHNYAVPPIIHRDIKSSNILLDSNWTAKVSDFGLSLMGPESDQQFMSARAVGTVGYIDPEYYVLNVLTAKSDVYGLGVVLLELLTGKRAVFRNDEGGAGPMAIVEYATPLIAAGMLRSVVDERVGQPGMPETEAVELMAYTALHSVKLEGKERPNITDIVANLERALALCEEVHTSFSSTTFSIPSD